MSSIYYISIRLRRVVKMGSFGFSLQSFILELDGKPVGRIGNVSGGLVKSDIVSQSSDFRIKHISVSSPEPVSFTCGAGMSRVFYDWLKDAFDQTFSRRNGAIVAIDSQQKEVSRIEFKNALITLIVLPAVETASKDSAIIKVAFRAESVQMLKGGGRANVGGYLSPHPKPWNLKNYTLSIDGLEKECGTVTKIDYLGLGQKIQEDPDGISRIVRLEPAASDRPDLNITLPNSSANGFIGWFKNDSTTNTVTQKTGLLEYRGPDSKSVYFSLAFSGLGVIKSSTSKGADTSQQPVAVGLTYNSVKFSAHSHAIL
jgi:hypothetical protein